MKIDHMFLHVSVCDFLFGAISLSACLLCNLSIYSSTIIIIYLYLFTVAIAIIAHNDVIIKKKFKYPMALLYYIRNFYFFKKINSNMIIIDMFFL